MKIPLPDRGPVAQIPLEPVFLIVADQILPASLE